MLMLSIFSWVLETTFGLFHALCVAKLLPAFWVKMIEHTYYAQEGLGRSCTCLAGVCLVKVLEALESTVMYFSANFISR